MNSGIQNTILQKAGSPIKKIVRLKNKVENTKFLSKFTYWSWIILCLIVSFQCIFFWTTANITAMICVIFAWLVLTTHFFKKTVLLNYPLSSFLIIGFTATQFYFPLVFTTFEFKPLIFNLNLPYEVFFHSTASLIVLVSAHYLYRALRMQTSRRTDSLLSRSGFFKAPQELQFWMMGVLGLIANLYVFLFSTTISTEVSGTPVDKMIQALIPFSYAPYFIPFTALYGGNKKVSKNIISMLVCFTILLFILSIVRNSRGAFMLGFTGVGFAYLLGLLLGVFKTPMIVVKNVFIGIVAFWLITGPLADLGTAMVIVRSQRNEISKSELIDLTLDAFKNKKAIDQRRLEDKTSKSDWDERYLDNIFTARFANLKFNDASLVQASIVGEKNPAMLKYSLDYIWGALPGPVLKIINPGVDKEMIYSVSFGDYIYHLAGAGSVAFGGFRTGHFAGTGMAAFGLWYLAILGLGIIPIYFLFDKLSIKENLSLFGGQVISRRLCFSTCGLLALTSIFQFLPTESVVGTLTFLVRGYLQMILLYFIIFHSTILLSNLVKRLIKIL